MVSAFLWLFIRASARVADGRLASVSRNQRQMNNYGAVATAITS